MAREDGVVLVLVALSMVIFLGMAALAIDLGSIYKAQEQAQSAADAAALAAAQDLPSNDAQATTDANNYATTNDPGSTVAVSAPYGSATGKVKVSVSASAPTYFAQIFGLTSERVSATAVAGTTNGVHPAAIFADNTACSTSNGVVFDGTGDVVSGGIVSNSNLTIYGSNFSISAATYGGPNKCAYTSNGNNNTFGSGPTPTTATAPWPYDYTSYGANPANCTSSNSSTGVAYSWSSGTINPGVYCAPNGTISITGTVTGNGVTLIANSFALNGSGISLTPNANAHNLVIYQTGTGILSLNGSGILDGGTIFAPSATVQIDGSGTAVGFVEAQNVLDYGSDLSFTGNGPPIDASTIELTQ